MDAVTQANGALSSESRLLAGLSELQTDAGNSRIGILLALAGLPNSAHGKVRPYVAETDAALYKALVRRDQVAEMTGTGFACFDSGNPRIIVGTPTQAVTIWEVAKRRATAVLQLDQDLDSAACSHDGNWIVTGGGVDGGLWLWDLQSGKLVKRLPDQLGRVRAVAFSPDDKLFATLSSINNLVMDKDKNTYVWVATNIWSLPNGDLVQALEQPRADEPNFALAHNLQFDQQGQRLLTVSPDGYARLYSVKDGHLIRSFGSGGDLSDGGFGPDDATVFLLKNSLWTPPLDSFAEAFDTETGRRLGILQHLGPNAWLLRLHPLKTFVFTAGSDGILRGWNTRTYQQIGTIKYGVEITALSFSPGLGKDIVIGDGQGRIAVYPGKLDGSTLTWGASSRIDVLHAADVGNVSVSPDGKYILSAGGGTVSISLANGDPLTLLRRMKGNAPFQYYALSRDGGVVLTVTQDDAAQLWSIASGKVIGGFDGVAIKETEPMYTAFSDLDTTHRRVLLGFLETTSWAPDIDRTEQEIKANRIKATRTVSVWDFSGKRLAALTEDAEAVRAAVFADNGNMVISLGDKGRVWLWDLTTDQPISLTQSVAAMDVARRSGLLATAHQDGVVRLWDIRSQQLLRELDARKIASPGNVCTSIERDARNYVNGYSTDGLVTKVRFSRDEQKLALGFRDGAVCVLNVASLSAVVAIPGVSAFSQLFDFSPDGAEVLVSHGPGDQPENRPLTIWNADTGALIKHVEVTPPTKQSSLSGQPWELAQSPDGAIITAVKDGDQIQVWDVRRLAFKMQLPFRVTTDGSFGNKSVLFLPDSSGIVFVTPEGTLEIHRIFTSIEKEVEFAEQQAISPMTADEKLRFRLESRK